MKRLWFKGLAAFVAVAGLLYGGAVGYMYFRQTVLLYPGAGVVYSVDYSGLGLEETRIKTADGETLQARLLPPQPGQPVVLFFHGNGGGGHVRAHLSRLWRVHRNAVRRWPLCRCARRL